MISERFCIWVELKNSIAVATPVKSLNQITYENRQRPPEGPKAKKSQRSWVHILSAVAFSIKPDRLRCQSFKTLVLKFRSLGKIKTRFLDFRTGCTSTLGHSQPIDFKFTIFFVDSFQQILQQLQIDIEMPKALKIQR